MSRRQSFPITILFILCIVVFTYLAQMNQIDLTSFQDVWGKANATTTAATTTATTTKTMKHSLRFIWDTKPSQASDDDSSEDEDDDDDDQSNKDSSESKDSDDTKSIPPPRPDKSSSQQSSSSSVKPPKIAWLASYPNSGTSYTMTTVERSTDLSTATMYGIEIATKDKDTSELVMPGGPLWEGMSGKRGTTIRPLPTTYVLTKTHCGGRCIKCPATEYVVDLETFRQACLRTTGYDPPRERFDRPMTVPVERILHLIRSPFTNIVARFHLEQRHFAVAGDDTYTRDAAGFRQWCRDLDETYADSEHLVWKDDPALEQLFRQVPCRAEFYKYTQWHNHMFQLQDMLKSPSKDYLVVHYEDYERDLNATIGTIMDFLQQQVVNPLREFRPLPDYSDHFSKTDRRRVRQLIQYMSTSETWKMLQRYLD